MCCCGFSETDSWLISVGELDAGSFKSTLNCINSPLFQWITSLEPGDRVDRNLCRQSKLSNTKSEGSSCHSTLHRHKNHYNVPILVDSTDFSLLETVQCTDLSTVS